MGSSCVRELEVELTARVSTSWSNPWKLTKLEGLWRRLEAGDALSDDVAASARRNNLDTDTEEKLICLFLNSYGRLLLRCLDEFWPYEVHNRAALAHEHKLRNSASRFHSLLFDGQSQARVFRNFIERMKSLEREYKDIGRQVPPEIAELLKDFVEKNDALDREVAGFREERKNRFLADVPGWLRSPGAADSSVDALCRNNFTTAAFQAALIIAFFSVVEFVSDSREGNGDSRLNPETLDSLLTEYLESINQFFHPTSEPALKNIFKTLSGMPEFDKENSTVTISKWRTIRKILIPGELNPNEWARLRYIFLELWKSDDPEISKAITDDLEKCRRQSFDRLFRHTKSQYAEEHGKQEANISPKVERRLQKQCIKEMQAALKPLGTTLAAEDLLDERSDDEDESEDVGTED